MTQDEHWQKNFDEVKSFIESNKRNLSKYNLEERWLYAFFKHARKQMNAGALKEPRLSLFKELLALSEQYKRKNQYE